MEKKKITKTEFTNEEVKACVGVITDEINFCQSEVNRLMRLVTKLMTGELVDKADLYDILFGSESSEYIESLEYAEDGEDGEDIYAQIYKKLKP